MIRASRALASHYSVQSTPTYAICRQPGLGPSGLDCTARPSHPLLSCAPPFNKVKGSCKSTAVIVSSIPWSALGEEPPRPGNMHRPPLRLSSGHRLAGKSLRRRSLQVYAAPQTLGVNFLGYISARISGGKNQATWHAHSHLAHVLLRPQSGSALKNIYGVAGTNLRIASAWHPVCMHGPWAVPARIRSSPPVSTWLRAALISTSAIITAKRRVNFFDRQNLVLFV